MTGSPTTAHQEVQRVTAAESSPRHNLTAEVKRYGCDRFCAAFLGTFKVIGVSFFFQVDKSNEEGERISFSVPGASDCLHSSEDCVQFQIKKDGDKERWSKSREFFSTLPLDTDTSESCSVYTSNKLDFL